MREMCSACGGNEEVVTDTELIDVIENLLDSNLREIYVTASVTIQAKYFYKGIEIRFSGGPWRPTLRQAIKAFEERRER